MQGHIKTVGDILLADRKKAARSSGGLRTPVFASNTLVTSSRLQSNVSLQRVPASCSFTPCSAPAPTWPPSSTTSITHNTTSSIMFKNSDIDSSTFQAASIQNYSLPRTKRPHHNKNVELSEFKRTRLGIDDSLSATQRIGESSWPPITDSSQYAAPHGTGTPLLWPTPVELKTTGFGKVSRHHSFRQEASFETVLIILFKQGFFSADSLAALTATNPLINHLHAMLHRLKYYDFSSLREYNTNWAAQTEISLHKTRTTLACLLHYDGRVSDLMRFCGNNYTGAYRDIAARAARLKGLVDDDLLRRYVSVMAVGAPTKFNAETTRANALLHWRFGNHTSITPNIKNGATMCWPSRTGYRGSSLISFSHRSITLLKTGKKID